MASLSVGQDVKSYCGKCKMSLYHTIMVMEGNTPKKVQCNTCKASHAFRDAPGAKKRSSSGTTRKRTVSKPVSELWKEAIESSTKRSRAYSIREVFEVGDIVDHVKFGTGIVQALMDGDKIEVMFQNDIKTLVHSK